MTCTLSLSTRPGSTTLPGTDTGLPSWIVPGLTARPVTAGATSATVTAVVAVPDPPSLATTWAETAKLPDVTPAGWLA